MIRPHRAAWRIAHRRDFPDYIAEELLEIGELMLARQNDRFSAQATQAARLCGIRARRICIFEGGLEAGLGENDQ